LGKSLKYGAVFGILNPSPLQSSSSSDTLISAKITHATQLIHLGTCPSLGFCTCRKKDGTPCSMPCDVSRGARVCFYHTMHQEAQKVRAWNAHNKGSTKASGDAAGIVVREGPAKRLAPTRQANPTSSKDPALSRLLGGRLPASPAKKRATAQGSSAPAGPAYSAQDVGMMAPKQTPGLGPFAPPSRPAPSDDMSSVERQILSLFPDGIPAPNPNRPMESRQHYERTLQDRLKASGSLGSSATLPSAAPPVTQVTMQRPAKAVSAKVPETAPEGKVKRGTNFQKLESEFGRKAARQLAFNADPRFDVVRKQSSRFQSAAEQEQAAKRMRRLHELEALDAAQEMMEELKSMKVRAWRCKTCFTTFESMSQRQLCVEQGHTVSEKEATKTRWECAGCRHSEEVLDRQLPAHCRNCNRQSWKQVSLRKLRRAAPMERDLLLPRGEELPFLNSIHIPELSRAQLKPVREAKDDYEGL